MEENKPVFKFTKKIRTIGDFDVNDITLYTLLIKEGSGFDFDKFTHFWKGWNIEETADELDGDGNVVTPGIRKVAQYAITQGFIRDGKFIVGFQQTFSHKSFTEIHKNYIDILKTAVDAGYKKDVDNYDNKDQPIPPKYYANNQEMTNPFAAIKGLRPIVKVDINTGNTKTNP